MQRLRSTPSLETVVVLAVVAVGVVATAGPISDNSMLWHLRTGMDMVATGDIPHSDPYSFTATGSPWTVQSWFAELLYGWLHAIGGWHLVIGLSMILTGVTAGVMAVLSRTGSMSRTLFVAVLVTVLAFPFWNHRPLLFGLACLAVSVLIFERKSNPLWLVAIAWLWVNTHGSFPLLFIYLGARIIGDCLDRRSLRPEHWQYLAFALAGVLLGAANPFGFELLTFPFRALGGKGEIFGAIVEWQSPNLHSSSGVVTLLALLSAFAVLMRTKQSWAVLLPVLAFTALALYSQRNLPALAIALAPALAQSLKASAGEQNSSPPSPLVVWAAIATVALAVGASSVRVASAEPVDLERYPQKAWQWLDANGYGSKRIMASDVVGGYRIFVEGRQANVFIDDRYDMYPTAVSNDYIDLFKLNEPGPQILLDRHAIDAVVWQTGRPLEHWLQADDRWQPTYTDDKWSVYVRRP